MSFTSSLALSSPVLPASQCNIRHLFCAECKMLSWLQRGSREGLFCHFWQLHHSSAERTWEWPAVSAPSSPPPRLIPKPHGSLMMSQPQSSLVVAFLQLSQHGHVVPQPILPVLVLQLHLLPYTLTPRFVSLGTLVPQPSDTSIRASRSPPHTSALNFFAHLCGLPHLHSASCFLLVQQLQISSGLCKPGWPSLPPIGLQLCQIQQGPNSSLGEEGFHSKFVFQAGYSPSALGCHVDSLISHGYPLIIVYRSL